MMSSRVIIIAVAVLLASLATNEGMSLGVELHCRCIKTESRRIRFIEKVELIPPNPHCDKLEVIATLRKSGRQVCLDPEALWVKEIIDKITNSTQ
ncbi:C-X-C motif chemokine 2 [Betta splendens]|uniref:C-X-C motif chemokine 2 n=1 Tax=Betta splendens TaxID=158456 RepID=A0A6P7L2X4_BETSP|nr:C-X-C motif chemokine 2 [Betta splendens]